MEPTTAQHESVEHDCYYWEGGWEKSLIQVWVLFLYAADPQFTTLRSVPLYYVGRIGQQVTLLPLVPPGVMKSLYHYVWLDSRNHELGGPRHTQNVADNSLSITSLQTSDAGRYALRVKVQIDNTRNSTYNNNSYTIFVQGKSVQLPQLELGLCRWCFILHWIWSPKLIFLILELPLITFLSRAAVLTKEDSMTIHENFTCIAEGFPNVTILWLHKNESVADNPSKYRVTPIRTGNRMFTSTLTLMDLRSGDSGELTCMASIEGCNDSEIYNHCIPEEFPTLSLTTLTILSKLHLIHTASKPAEDSTIT